MTIVANGNDLAKNVLTVHGVKAAGQVELRQPRVSRAKLGPAAARTTERGCSRPTATRRLALCLRPADGGAAPAHAG